MYLCCQKLQQKLEQQQKKEPEKKKQQQQKKKQPEEKQQEHYVQALVALHGEVTNKLSILGLMPSSPLAEVNLLVLIDIIYLLLPLVFSGGRRYIC